VGTTTSVISVLIIVVAGHFFINTKTTISNYPINKKRARRPENENTYVATQQYLALDATHQKLLVEAK